MTEENKNVELPILFAQKAGMTRVFSEDGRHIPVSVVKLLPNHISEVRTLEKNGYSAYQIAYGEKRAKLVTKPVQGVLKKANIENNYTKFAEYKIDGADASQVGKQLSWEVFAPGSFVDVQGVSKGKGFQGVMKRHGFQGGPAAHGSHFHRGPGSIGNRATPGRVFAQKKMPGHMGHVKTTVQNLEIVAVNVEKGYLLVKGSIPGAKNGFLKVTKALKK